MWTHGWRDSTWSELDRKWDLVIVGGGITGAGIFAEAVRMGLDTLLVDARDFASGTSSRSTKLVHGGLRYLRNAQVGVTRESVLERERLMQEAAGLVKPLGFYLTTFERDQMPGWMVGAGLAVYDLIAGKWAHKKYSAEDLQREVPSLAGASLRGGYHYFDAQTDDARLVLRVIREGVRAGGTAINYVKAIDLLRNQAGYVNGVVLQDEDPAASGRSLEIEARAVVNAAGTWSDVLREKVGGERRLRPIRGSHLTFEATRIPIPEAISLMHPRDNRAVFAIPWEGATIIGTTDIDHHDELDNEPRCSADEATYILEAAKHAFPSLELSEKDIVASWSGVRSVIDSGAENPSKESRDHALWNENGLLTVTGGKLTTFRIMARDALLALRHMIADLAPPRSRRRIVDAVDSEALASFKLEERDAQRLFGRFGAEALEVATTQELDHIGPTPTLWAEVAHAASSEGVIHLDDLLLRRVRLGLLLPEGGLREINRVRALAQPRLRWSDVRWDQEVARYRSIWQTHYGTTFA